MATLSSTTRPLMLCCWAANMVGHGWLVPIALRRKSCSRSNIGHIRVVECWHTPRRPTSMSTCVWASVCIAGAVLCVCVRLRARIQAVLLVLRSLFVSWSDAVAKNTLSNYLQEPTERPTETVRRTHCSRGTTQPKKKTHRPPCQGSKRCE